LSRPTPARGRVQRLATLAHTLGRFKEEAQAWELLGDPQKAAAAFERAARQAIQLTPENEDEIAACTNRHLIFMKTLD